MKRMKLIISIILVILLSGTIAVVGVSQDCWRGNPPILHWTDGNISFNIFRVNGKSKLTIFVLGSARVVWLSSVPVSVVRAKARQFDAIADCMERLESEAKQD